jgi:hypothetical protein
MSNLGMVEIPRPSSLRACLRRSESSSCRRIQVFSERRIHTPILDAAMRRNDGNASQLPVDKFRTPRFGAKGCSVRAGKSLPQFSPGTKKNFGRLSERTHHTDVEHGRIEADVPILAPNARVRDMEPTNTKHGSETISKTVSCAGTALDREVKMSAGMA